MEKERGDGKKREDELRKWEWGRRQERLEGGSGIISPAQKWNNINVWTPKINPHSSPLPVSLLPSPPPMVSQEQRLVEQWGMLLQADTILGVLGQGCQLSIHPTHPPLEGSL